MIHVISFIGQLNAMPLSEAQLRSFSPNIRLKENFEPTTSTPLNSTFSSTTSGIENQVCSVIKINFAYKSKHLC